MGVEARTYQTLSDATALTALVDEAVYPENRPQNSALPAVVFSRAPGGEMVNSLEGYVKLEHVIIETVIFATAVDARREVSDAVFAAMTASTWFSAILPDPPYDDYDDETQLYERTLLFSVWNQTT